MRQIVKRVKDGQEITFTCSQCGDLIHDMFVPIGKKCEPNWDKIPDKCSCGARLTIRQPIIDSSDIDDSYADGYNANDRIIRRNKPENISEKYDIYKGRIKDLETAISIDFLDMRLNGFKRDSIKIPDNIDHLRIECIKRNILHTESNVKHLSCIDDTCEKEDAQKRLNELRQRHDELSKKLDDKKDSKKDFDKNTWTKKDIKNKFS